MATNTEKKEIAIRFLKSGLLKTAVPAESSYEEILEHCQNTLHEASDKQLIDAMCDIGVNGSDMSCFDADCFSVEAIEDVEDNYTFLHSTRVWDQWCEPEVITISKGFPSKHDENSGPYTAYVNYSISRPKDNVFVLQVNNNDDHSDNEISFDIDDQGLAEYTAEHIEKLLLLTADEVEEIVMECKKYWKARGLEDVMQWKRFESKEEISEYLKENYDLSGELVEIDESGLVSDEAFLLGINDDWGYVDIYYLKNRFGTYLITGISVSDE